MLQLETTGQFRKDYKRVKKVEFSHNHSLNYGVSGYKFKLLKDNQINLLMGYGINTRLPLFAKMYRVSFNDKTTIENLTDLLKLSGILFVADSFYYQF